MRLKKLTVDGKKLADDYSKGKIFNKNSLTVAATVSDIENCHQQQQVTTVLLSGQKVKKKRSASVAIEFIQRYSTENHCDRFCYRNLMSNRSLASSTFNRPSYTTTSQIHNSIRKQNITTNSSLSSSAISLNQSSSINNLAHRSKQLLNSVSENVKCFLNNRLKSSSENMNSSLASSCTTLKILQISEDDKKRSLMAVSSPNIHETLRPLNRLRVPSVNSLLSHPLLPDSQLCSRCSSLLSMLSSSRYSLCKTGTGFVPIPSIYPEKATFLCKLCLNEVDYHEVFTIQQCSCHFCNECMKAYVQYEIAEGAYDIACPDAQCPSEGVLTIFDIESLVPSDVVHKHKKYRLNREIDVDQTRTWCPRVGCETVCNLCTVEQCQPQSVHCSTCTTNFCSNCKNDWHPGLSCDENTKKLVKEGKKTEDISISFNSDLIKCCPMCNVLIEKDEGCAQMMCKRCKHVFCWYCLASLDDDFLLTHYDRGPCKNKLGHSRASVIWHRAQVIGIFAGFGILLLIASPLLLLAAPCIVCCKCRVCNNVENKLDHDNDLNDEIPL